MKKVRNTLLIGLTAITLAACSEEKAKLDSNEIVVNEQGDFVISGTVPEEKSFFYVNDQMITTSEVDSDGNFKVGVHLNEPSQEAKFKAEYLGETVIEEETLKLDTSAFEQAIQQTQKEEVEKEKAKEKNEQEKKQENESKAKEESAEKEEINKEVAIHLDQNKGWALGTIDENANPIEDGTPNPDYANWIYVSSIIYDGDAIEVKVTSDFKKLSKEEKDYLASSSQNIVVAYGVLEKKPPVYFFNGEIPYGGSDILSTTDYSWNK